MFGSCRHLWCHLAQRRARMASTLYKGSANAIDDVHILRLDRGVDVAVKRFSLGDLLGLSSNLAVVQQISRKADPHKPSNGSHKSGRPRRSRMRGCVYVHGSGMFKACCGRLSKRRMSANILAVHGSVPQGRCGAMRRCKRPCKIGLRELAQGELPSA